MTVLRRSSAVVRWRDTVLTLWRAGWWGAILPWRWAVASWTTRRRHATATGHIGFLVLGIVAGIDGAED